MTKYRITFLLIIISLFFFEITMSLAQPKNISGGLTRHNIVYDGSNRSYLLYLPSTYNPDKSYPVMLVFHGGGGQAKFMIKMTGMNKLSEKNDFIVVYPDGTGSKLLPALKTWNTGNCCGRAKKLNTDDTGFVRAIIKDIKRTININTEKIFATGISNGAMMSYKLACEAPDLVSGIAPVAGTLNIASCKPDQPVPVIHFHGTADNFCRYEGGVGSKSVSRRNFKSVEYSINTWKTINGCSNETSEFYKKGKAQCIQYEKCKNNSSVVLCTIIDGGHTWPDGHSQYPALMGEVNQDVNATQLMWEFFNIERSK